MSQAEQASLNVEQQINDTLGLFFRAGWADGNVEPSGADRLPAAKGDDHAPQDI